MPVRKGETIDPSRTRRRILDTAAEAVCAPGVGSVSVNAIARRAGASKETVYRAFGNREGLIRAAIEDRSTVNAQRLADLERDHPQPRVRLDALVAFHAAWFGTDDFNGCPIVRAVLESVEPLNDAGAAHLARYTGFLDTIVDELHLPATTTLQILGLLEGATIIAAINGPAAGRTVLGAIALLVECQPGDQDPHE
jgi:AcrR family transcriptional regulator